MTAAFDEFERDVPHRVDGSFGLAAHSTLLEQTLALELRVNRARMGQAKVFIPKKLDAGLRVWLNEAPQQGDLRNARFGYIAHTRGNQGRYARRPALRVNLTGGGVVYDERWPPVRRIEGQLYLSGPRFSADISSAESFGLRLGASRLTLPADAQRLTVDFTGATTVNEGLDFVRQTPLKQTLAFVAPQWQGEGRLRGSGTLKVPLGGTAAVLDTNIRLQFENLVARLPELRVVLNDLAGEATYATALGVSSPGITGRLFESPLKAVVRTRSDLADYVGEVVSIDVRGELVPQDVYRLLDMQDPGFVAGRTTYDALLQFPAGDQSPSIGLTTDLAGVSLTLPGQLAKDTADRSPLRSRTWFNDEGQRTWINYAGMSGLVDVEDGLIRRGVLGLDEPPNTLDASMQAVHVHGVLRHFDIATLGADESLLGEIPVQFDALRVERLTSGDLELGAVAVSGSLLGAAFELELAGEQLLGDVRATADGPMYLRLERAYFPASEETSTPADPLEVALIQQLPAMDVEIADVRVGAELYGEWRFKSRTRGDDLLLSDVMATLRGVAVTAPEVVWHGVDNYTQTQAQIVAGDLAEVLPQWGYAASLTTERADLASAVRWPGSPLNFDVERLTGELTATAADGHFLETDGGGNALRIFSLLNFTALAKRINLDFSDVVGKGISFNTIDANVALDEGRLVFTEPMRVEGTGSSFRFGGKVNMITGDLDNEMIVTLPVSKGLPWYATYIGLANPLAGLGVIVGERVLRKPLEQLSSAKYRIGGSLDDPKVEFVGLFDTKMDIELEPYPEAAEAGLSEAAGR